MMVTPGTTRPGRAPAPGSPDPWWAGARATLVASAWLAFGACGGDSPSRQQGGPVTVPVEAIQTVATLEGVTRVVDVELDVDGRTWVLNSMAPFFVVVGSDGRVERQFGEAGGGPQEFTRPVALVRGPRPAEVWAYDVGRNALIRLAGGDRRDVALPTETIPLPSLISFKGAGINPAPPWVEGTEGGFLVARARDTMEESALRLWNADILRIADDGSTRDVEVRLPVADLVGDPAARYTGATILLPYPLWTACPDGTFVLYDPLANTLRRFGGDGGAEEEASPLPDERQAPMTADLVFDMFFRQFAGDRPADQVPDREEMRRLTRDQNEEFVRNSAPSFPEFSDVRCTEDGTLWLRRFDATSGRLGMGSDWLRVEADWTIVEVILPQMFTAFRVDGGRMWGVLQDSLGVESLAWIDVDPLL